MNNNFYSRKDGSNKEILINHLNRTSELCEIFASEFNNDKIGKLLGNLHDVGKATKKFQEVLNGKRVKVDHAIVGSIFLANIRISKLRKIEKILAIIIAAHHSELYFQVDCSIPKDFTQPIYTNDNGKECSIENEQEFKNIQNYIIKNKLVFALTDNDYFDLNNMTEDELMFYIRMLYSCLVDADYTASAEFKNSNYLIESTGEDLNPLKLFQNLLDYRDNIIKNSSANLEMNNLRNLVFEDCIRVGKESTNLYTLSAPTGTAKTLALLGFALQNAIHNNKKRIIIVLPYLSIIEQNTKIYKEICGDNIVLEDDSSTEYTEKTKIYSERWSSPIIITTSVKFFETLFKSKSTDCRRLHNIANSVIVFDEAHSLSSEILDCTLKVINELPKHYNSTVLFSSATPLNYNCRKNINWNPVEIIKDVKFLYLTYSKIKKLQVNWDIDTLKTYKDLCNETFEDSTIYMFNTKKQALNMYNTLTSHYDESCCFLISTNLCSQHKLDVINEIRTKLKNKELCKISSTQCIEAGVDISTTQMFRMLSPYQSIIQASGRCVRDCNEQGFLTIFDLDDSILNKNESKFPPGEYKNSVLQVKLLLKNHNNYLNINDIDLLNEYSLLLYNTVTSSKDKLSLTKAIEDKDFKKVDEEYQLINSKSLSVIVPYSKTKNEYFIIKDKLEKNSFDNKMCLTKQDMKFCRKFVVNISNYEDKKNIETLCQRLYFRINNDLYATNWFILDDTLPYYDEKIGLNFDTKLNLII